MTGRQKWFFGSLAITILGGIFVGLSDVPKEEMVNSVSYQIGFIMLVIGMLNMMLATKK